VIAITYARSIAHEASGLHKVAREINDRKRARSGEDFSALAKQYSEDTATKDKNGELPPFARDVPGVPTELSAAAFSMTNNQISDVITLAPGYDIIKLIEKIPAQTVPFAGGDTKAQITDPATGQTATITIRDFLTNEAINAKAPNYFQELKKDGNVEILDADLKTAVSTADAAAMAATTNAPALSQ